MVAHQERLASKNIEQCGSCVITCLEQGGYDLHMGHHVVSCFVKMYIGLSFLMPAYPGCPEKRGR